MDELIQGMIYIKKESSEEVKPDKRLLRILSILAESIDLDIEEAEKTIIALSKMGYVEFVE